MTYFYISFVAKYTSYIQKTERALFKYIGTGVAPQILDSILSKASRDYKIFYTGFFVANFKNLFLYKQHV